MFLVYGVDLLRVIYYYMLLVFRQIKKKNSKSYGI